MRKPTRVRWSPEMDVRYFQATWRAQRRFVKMWLLPAPPALGTLIFWLHGHLPGSPPLWLWAILLGSVGFCLMAAFLYWRCPSCDQLLYRTSKSGDEILFWLANPEDCPECGAPLKPKAKSSP